MEQSRDFWLGVAYALEYVYEYLDQDTIFESDLAKQTHLALGDDYYLVDSVNLKGEG